MPTERAKGSPKVNEINRLTALGLNVMTAMAVADGKMDEASEVARAEEGRKVDIWCRGRKNIPTALTAVWDCDPANFYLVFDGDSPSDHASTDFVLIYADVADVKGRLTHAASRDRDAWHQRYKRKSCGIAYRWLHGSGVTPPLIKEFQGQVHIVGGMHRFHLAKYYGTTRMPFLVRKVELTAVMALVPLVEEAAGPVLHGERE